MHSLSNLQRRDQILRWISFLPRPIATSVCGGIKQRNHITEPVLLVLRRVMAFLDVLRLQSPLPAGTAIIVLLLYVSETSWTT